MTLSVAALAIALTAFLASLIFSSEPGLPGPLVHPVHPEMENKVTAVFVASPDLRG